MKIFACLGLTLLLFACGESPSPKTGSQPAPPAVSLPDTLTFDVASYAEQALETPSLDTFQVGYDHVYHEGRTYTGVDFRSLLEREFQVSKLPADQYRLYFHCEDRYVVTMMLSDVMRAVPQLALQDMDAVSGDRWDPIVEHGMDKDMSPAYLVWEGVGAAQDADFVWPYALVRLVLVREAAS